MNLWNKRLFSRRNSHHRHCLALPGLGDNKEQTWTWFYDCSHTHYRQHSPYSLHGVDTLPLCPLHVTVGGGERERRAVAGGLACEKVFSLGVDQHHVKVFWSFHPTQTILTEETEPAGSPTPALPCWVYGTWSSREHSPRLCCPLASRGVDPWEHQYDSGQWEEGQQGVGSLCPPASCWSSGRSCLPHGLLPPSSCQAQLTPSPPLVPSGMGGAIPAFCSPHVFQHGCCL